MKFNIPHKISIKKYLLFLIIVFAFLVRIVNLNYNSFLNDEAIYVVIGNLGLFHGDWSTYNANTWMAGSQYLYPTFTAIAYNFGGVLGSRFLNVIFGVLSAVGVYFLTLNLTTLFKVRKKYLAGILSALIVSFSSVSLYVSRLATLDMPSYFFFIFGLYFLSKVEIEKNAFNQSKLYFIACIFLVFSFLIKIIVGIYLPLILIISFFMINKQGKEKFHLWKIYFLLPLLVFCFFYFIFQIDVLFNFLKFQSMRENIAYSSLTTEVLTHIKLVIPFWVIGSFGMIFKKRLKEWLILNSGAFLIIFIHFFSKRISTFDKHLFLTVLFFAIIFGIGTAQILARNLSKLSKIIIYLSTFIIITVFGIFSFKDIQKYNNIWGNTNILTTYLAGSIKNGDKVLAEEGPQAVLATINKNHPSNVTTFDWFEYKGETGIMAYGKGVDDGYFDYIQLNSSSRPKTSVYNNVYQKVWNYLPNKYQLVFKQGEYSVFKKIK